MIDPKRGAQVRLFPELSATTEWDRDTAGRALDELFHNAKQYRTSSSYRNFVDFIGRFRFYSPYNAMLIHVQMPGATFVATAHRWFYQYGRQVAPNAHALVILQPMGPVMFVFDVSDTEPTDQAQQLPPEVERPFETRHGKINDELVRTIENAKRDGIFVCEREAGTQSAGVIAKAQRGLDLTFQVKWKPKPELTKVPRRYDLVLNAIHSAEAKYATLAHELAHLYCGHLGTPNKDWWPDRSQCDRVTAEFEAESVCYFVCTRLGIDNPSDEYLAGYLRANAEIPSISLELVVKAAGLIEQMGQSKMKMRKDAKK